VSLTTIADVVSFAGTGISFFAFWQPTRQYARQTIKNNLMAHSFLKFTVYSRLSNLSLILSIARANLGSTISNSSAIASKRSVMEEADFSIM
jgi:hypothetical protein